MKRKSQKKVESARHAEPGKKERKKKKQPIHLLNGQHVSIPAVARNRSSSNLMWTPQPPALSNFETKIKPTKERTKLELELIN